MSGRVEKEGEKDCEKEKNPSKKPNTYVPEPKPIFQKAPSSRRVSARMAGRTPEGESAGRKTGERYQRKKRSAPDAGEEGGEEEEEQPRKKKMADKNDMLSRISAS